MTKQGHTAGPWISRPRQDGLPGLAISPLNGGLAVAIVMANKRSADEKKANARLMAAAPDLLNGCNALLGLIQLVCGRGDIPPAIKEALQTSHRLEEAREAVAKAQGGAA